jgi:stage V sporulation protein B
MRLPDYIKDTFFRSGSIFLVKFIGIIGRVSLSRMVGAEGIGLYQVAYSFYGLMLIIISGGFPTTLALSTAKNASHGWKLFQALSLFTLVAGGILSFFTFQHSEAIAHFLGQSKLGFTIRCLSPALFIVPALSLLRGYLQGLKRFKIIALSEVMEQIVRVSILLLMVSFFLPAGVTKAVGGSLLGTVAGALFAFLLLIVLFSRFRGPSVISESTSAGLKHSMMSVFLKTSFAIAFTRLLIPISDFIDSILIPKRLIAAGYSATESTEIYGVIIGMAVIVAYMPTVFTAALSHVLTIKIAAEWQSKRLIDFQLRIIEVFKLAWLWGLISGLLLFLYAPDLSLYIFNSTEVEKPIRYLAVLPLIVGIREISTSILWVINRKTVPIAGLICGITINIILIYFIVAIPNFGNIGISLSIVAMEGVAVLWNLIALNVFRKGTVRFKMVCVDILIFATILYMISGLHTMVTQMSLFKPFAILVELFFLFSLTGWYVKMRFAEFWRR